MATNDDFSPDDSPNVDQQIRINELRDDECAPTALAISPCFTTGLY